MAWLSSDPAMGTSFVPFGAIVNLVVLIYFDGIWSKLRTSWWVIVYISIAATISLRKRSSASFHAPIGIETLQVRRALLFQFKRLKRLPAQVTRGGRWARICGSEHLCINTVVAIILIWYDTWPPRSLKAVKKRTNLASIAPQIKGRPHCCVGISSFGLLYKPAIYTRRSSFRLMCRIYTFHEIL